MAQADITQKLEPLFRGEDVQIQFKTTDPGDISAYTLTFVMSALTTGDGPITKTTGGGQITTNNTERTITVSLAAADSTSMSPGDFRIYLRRTDSGANRVLAFGTIPLF